MDQLLQASQEVQALRNQLELQANKLELWQTPPKRRRTQITNCNEYSSEDLDLFTYTKRKVSWGRFHRGHLFDLEWMSDADVKFYSHKLWPEGTNVWAKVSGLCYWPGIVWSMDKCPLMIRSEMRSTFTRGNVLVLFRGDHMLAWLSTKRLRVWSDSTELRLEVWEKWSSRSTRDWNVFLKGSAEISVKESECLSVAETNEIMREELKLDEDTTGDDGMQPAFTQEDQEKFHRHGLTPDWIVEAGCHVFQLKMPTLRRPHIRDLLDPCTNDLVNPNIPAEVLYDKKVNGLLLQNSWADKYIILNPDFDNQVMWRFVNRAIDEVENKSALGVLLLCRNSTDTGYFQRLKPFPRCFLRTRSIQFKDYEKTPIGFGIACFCMVPPGPDQMDIYRRFFGAFAPWGEVNIPLDQTFVETDHFGQLVGRLEEKTRQEAREHWAQCTKCQKWRIVKFEVLKQMEAEESTMIQEGKATNETGASLRLEGEDGNDHAKYAATTNNTTIITNNKNNDNDRNDVNNPSDGLNQMQLVVVDGNGLDQNTTTITTNTHFTGVIEQQFEGGEKNEVDKTTATTISADQSAGVVEQQLEVGEGNTSNRIATVITCSTEINQLQLEDGEGHHTNQLATTTAPSTESNALQQEDAEGRDPDQLATTTAPSTEINALQLEDGEGHHTDQLATTTAPSTDINDLQLEDGEGNNSDGKHITTNTPSTSGFKEWDCERLGTVGGCMAGLSRLEAKWAGYARRKTLRQEIRAEEDRLVSKHFTETDDEESPGTSRVSELTFADVARSCVERYRAHFPLRKISTAKARLEKSTNSVDSSTNVSKQGQDTILSSYELMRNARVQANLRMMRSLIKLPQFQKVDATPNTQIDSPSVDTSMPTCSNEISDPLMQAVAQSRTSPTSIAITIYEPRTPPPTIFFGLRPISADVSGNFINPVMSQESRSAVGIPSSGEFGGCSIRSCENQDMCNDVVMSNMNTPECTQELKTSMVSSSERLREDFMLSPNDRMERMEEADEDEEEEEEIPTYLVEAAEAAIDQAEMLQC